MCSDRYLETALMFNNTRFGVKPRSFNHYKATIMLISLNVKYFKLFSSVTMISGNVKLFCGIFFVYFWSCCVNSKWVNSEWTLSLINPLLYYYLLKFHPVGLHFSCHTTWPSLHKPAAFCSTNSERKLEGQVLCKYAMGGCC